MLQPAPYLGVVCNDKNLQFRFHEDGDYFASLAVNRMRICARCVTGTPFCITGA
jgi:hypothetical protein